MEKAMFKTTTSRCRNASLSSRRKSSRTYTDNNGYKRFKDSDKLVHRCVAEMKLGRPLKDTEIVHHKNRDKQDNSFDNLQVFKNQSEHWKIHKIDAAKYGWSFSLKGSETNKK